MDDNQDEGNQGYGEHPPAPPEKVDYNPYETSHQYGEYRTETPDNPALGIGSLVTGLLSWLLGCCCGPVGILLAIAAIVLGGIGLSTSGPGMTTGKGLSIAGLVMGILYLVFFVVMLLLYVAGVVGPELLKEMQQFQFDQ